MKHRRAKEPRWLSQPPAAGRERRREAHHGERGRERARSRASVEPAHVDLAAAVPRGSVTRSGRLRRRRGRRARARPLASASATSRAPSTQPESTSTASR